MLAGPSDFRVEPKHSAGGTWTVKHLGHNWTTEPAMAVHATAQPPPLKRVTAVEIRAVAPGLAPARRG
jgi:hypothetical protein